MAIQEDKIITRDIDYTIDADFAGDYDTNELIRHHYSYANKYKIDSGLSRDDRIFYDEAPLHLRFGLYIQDGNEEIPLGENAFFQYAPYQTFSQIKNGRLDDGYVYNDELCDEFIMCHYKVFDEYPSENCSSDPWIHAFGLGVNCDCCGVLLNAINKTKYGLCEDCDAPTEKEFEL